MTREEWRAETMDRIGRAVADARRRAGMSQQELAERIGSSRNAIQNLEARKGRTSSINVLDLIELAAALNVPPVSLLYPDLPDGDVEVYPGTRTSSINALTWFSGELQFMPDLSPQADDARTDEERQAAVQRAHALWEGGHLVNLSREKIQTESQIVNLAQLAQKLRDSGYPEGASQFIEEAAAKQRYLDGYIKVELRKIAGAVLHNAEG
ncbi:helix-turn-helix transcriptional regulator [Nocardia farcinica]|uniref:helix-turn-helix transcriptional regulator n=1 Tax=Nocardia farcinica TaxID=37329 RepID=UPI0018944D2D|nr:helix-turn-helix transcriptional regulator [Nocardia farcinica]MBF6393328.1 helix-turn-helix transcriptional regulator [Nocardia farcinica]